MSMRDCFAIKSDPPRLRVVPFPISCFRCNRQIYDEARAIWHKNGFILVKTTSRDLASRIPSLIRDNKAANIKDWQLVVWLDTPERDRTDHQPQYSILLVSEDLEAFCKRLSFRTLNMRQKKQPQVHIDLIFQSSSEYTGSVSIARGPSCEKQRLLMMPFSRLKGSAIQVFGARDDDLVGQFQRSVSEGFPYCWTCILHGVRRFLEGNEYSMANSPVSAFEKYQQSCESMYLDTDNEECEHQVRIWFRDSAPHGQGSLYRIRQNLRLRLTQLSLIALTKMKDWEKAYAYGRYEIEKLGSWAHHHVKFVDRESAMNELLYLTAIPLCKMGRWNTADELLAYKVRLSQRVSVLRGQFWNMKGERCYGELWDEYCACSENLREEAGGCPFLHSELDLTVTLPVFLDPINMELERLSARFGSISKPGYCHAG